MLDSERMLYARQLLLPEIGERGQASLCAARMRIAPDADVRAQSIASSYLERAGLPLMAADASARHAVVGVDVASSALVEQLAHEPYLREAAAWLAGSFAAVEAIKRVVHAGHSARLPSGFVLSSGDSLK